MVARVGLARNTAEMECAAVQVSRRRTIWSETTADKMDGVLQVCILVNLLDPHMLAVLSMMAVVIWKQVQEPMDTLVQHVQQRVPHTLITLFKTMVGACVAPHTALQGSTARLQTPSVEILVPERLRDDVVLDGATPSTELIRLQRQALLVLQVLQALLAVLVQLAPLAPPELRVPKVFREQWVHRERKAMLVVRAHQGSAA